MLLTVITMHEASIAQALLDTAVAALPKAGARITKITIVAGPFSGVEKESLTFYFTQISRGTPAHDAILEIKSQPARLVCKQCANTIAYTGQENLEMKCPQCSGPNKLEGGNDLYLDSIEVEED
jgi:hydrogenase nickel insertion protein HypA